jgi:hypothetical protein
MNVIEQKQKLQGILDQLTELATVLSLNKAIQNVKHNLQMLEYNNRPIGLKIPEKQVNTNYKQPIKPKRKDIWGL